MTTEALRTELAAGPVVALVPVGSVEPHGPHLPLATDTIISEAAADRAAALLRAAGVRALVAPAIPYGVTDFAAGFAGAVSVPAEALTPFLRAVVEAYLAAGFAHACLVNNHLEAAHDAAVRAAVEGLGSRASVACPLARRWARTLLRRGSADARRSATPLVLRDLARPRCAAAARDRRPWLAAAVRSSPDPLLSLSEAARAGENPTFSAPSAWTARTRARPPAPPPRRARPCSTGSRP